MTTLADPAGSPARKRVFVVEDELMIRMLLEDMLDELGFVIAASASRVDEATALAQTTDFDFAILDVNLAGQEVFPVAEKVAARGKPFLFATGYGDRVMPAPFNGNPTLQKPFQLDGLRQAVAKIALPV